MAGWGSGKEGSSRWGVGDEPSAGSGPVITPIDPSENESGIGRTRPLSIRITDDTAAIDPATIFVAVNGIQLVRGGVAVNGSTYTYTANQLNGFDIVVTPPAPFDAPSHPDVQIVASNAVAQTAVKVYSFTVGVGPRLIAVRNPSPGVLLADFNVTMNLDRTFVDEGNWTTAIVTDGAQPLIITKVSASSLYPARATLEYTGGGSFYDLTVYNITSKDGEVLEPGWNTVRFELTYGEEDEPQIRLFNSIFGPIGIAQREVSRRDIERHTANRSLAIGLDEQLRLRFQQIDGTAGRDGRPGALRSS